MRKLVYISLLGVLALGACSDSSKKLQSEFQAQRDSLQRVINDRDSEIDEIMGTVNEINEGFRQINEAQGRVMTEKAEGANMKDDIIENIQFIQQTMKENRDQIEKLKSRLKSSSLEGTKLKETISMLTSQLEEKAHQIEQLTAELAARDVKIEEQGKAIEQLSQDVSALAADNEEKAKTVAAQDKDINRAWFVFGTKSELKEQKIITKGDVLATSDFNKGYFTEIDIRKQKEVKLYSKSAKILTTHPQGSFSLDKDEKGQYVLHISNPNTFWSVSRYLVVQVR